MTFVQFSFDAFSHMKPVMIKDLGWLNEAIGSLRYPPYEKANVQLQRFLLHNRKIPMLSDLWPWISLVLGYFLAKAYQTFTWKKKAH